MISLNFNQIISEKLINYYIISNQEKIILDFRSIIILKKVIMPKSNFKNLYK